MILFVARGEMNRNYFYWCHILEKYNFVFTRRNINKMNNSALCTSQLGIASATKFNVICSIVRFLRIERDFEEDHILGS